MRLEVAPRTKKNDLWVILGFRVYLQPLSLGRTPGSIDIPVRGYYSHSHSHIFQTVSHFTLREFLKRHRVVSHYLRWRRVWGSILKHARRHRHACNPHRQLGPLGWARRSTLIMWGRFQRSNGSSSCSGRLNPGHYPTRLDNGRIGAVRPDLGRHVRSMLFVNTPRPHRVSVTSLRVTSWHSVGGLPPCFGSRHVIVRE